MTHSFGDITPAVDLTRERGTGARRAQQPLYVHLTAPCDHACPAGESIQSWLALAQAGQYRQGWETLVQDNPLPGVHGRVCYHPCEDGCNRSHVDAPVGIHAVERFLGDMAVAQDWPYPKPAAPQGGRVLVIGAGPSGLSAAYHLTRLGHAVEVHEAAPAPGGMLHFGIPAYRLPRVDLLAEIARIEAAGVKIVLNHKVADVRAEQKAGAFDAVFLAIGAHVARHVDIPARDAARVLDAISLLHDVSAGERPLLGRRVVVYGGGNTAMDAARTARRLGADEAMIVYRRDRAHMPARAFEADEALAEGIRIRWLSSIREIAGPELTVEAMELDANGRPHPTGRFETLPADAVVLALGQETDSTLLRGVPGIESDADGTVHVGPNMMTGYPGIFAGGDMVPSERTVAVAVGHGKRAARQIDAWLRGDSSLRLEPHQTREPTLVSFDMLHLPIYADASPSRQAELPPSIRTVGFNEVIAGLTEPEARHEAQRCFSCGTCFECDNCYAACPEDAIIKLGPGRFYQFDYEKCTGCAICFEECPCHAIEMTKVDS